MNSKISDRTLRWAIAALDATNQATEFVAPNLGVSPSVRIVENLALAHNELAVLYRWRTGRSWSDDCRRELLGEIVDE